MPGTGISLRRQAARAGDLASNARCTASMDCGRSEFRTLRPWLDLGFWDMRFPLGARSTPVPQTYAFLPVEGENLHQIPVGPVHAGIIEPGHFRFTAAGETVARLEERLGYVHKGIDSLMAGAALERGARLAARTSGDSTVAYGIAFARAVEAALDIEPPPRAHYLRALMAELERLANHFGDIGAICNDASFALMHAHCAILRELVLRAAQTCFGHRLIMDRVIPGGVTTDLRSEGVRTLKDLLQQVRDRFPRLIELYDNTASLQDRTAATGILDGAIARRFGAAGFVGRASGRDFDARKAPGYSPYSELDFTVPVLTAGDVNARVWICTAKSSRNSRSIETSNACRKGRSPSSSPVAAAKAWRWPKVSAATYWFLCGLRRVTSRAVICAIHPGFNGRCLRSPSRAISSPISRSAINRSIAPIRGMICNAGSNLGNKDRM